MYLRYQLAAGDLEKLLILPVHGLKHVDSAEIDVHAGRVADADRAIWLDLDTSFHSRIFDNDTSLLVITED